MISNSFSWSLLLRKSWQLSHEIDHLFLGVSDLLSSLFGFHFPDQSQMSEVFQGSRLFLLSSLLIFNYRDSGQESDPWKILLWRWWQILSPWCARIATASWPVMPGRIRAGTGPVAVFPAAPTGDILSRAHALSSARPWDSLLRRHIS